MRQGGDALLFMSNIAQDKQQYRAHLSTQRNQLSPHQRTIFSKQALERLEHYLASLHANTAIQLLSYQALPFELDTSPLFTHPHRQTFAPRMLEGNQLTWVEVDAKTQWQRASFGVLEPISGNIWSKKSAQTILICPLLGFDRAGNRLGMGKGYFDRWLEQHATSVEHQIGLAFSCQELPKVPTAPHDAPLSTIITELEVISCPAT